MKELMDAGGGIQSVPDLLCSENQSCIEDDNADDDDDKETKEDEEEWCDVDDEFLEVMVEREKRMHQTSAADNSWVKCARLEAFAWILKTRDKLCFRIQTAYLSLMYFDRFLSKRSIDSDSPWAFRLLSIACLSLAVKMEEVKLLLFEDYLSQDYNFEAKHIQRMELLVLSTLEWKMICVSPFSFCSHFLQKLCFETDQKDLEFKIPSFILAMVREVNLMAHSPSSIAAAAILVATDQSLTRHGLESKMNPIIKSGFPNCDDVFKCYETMRKLGMEEFSREFRIISVKSSQQKLRSRDIADAPSAWTKRRRLQFSSPR